LEDGLGLAEHGGSHYVHALFVGEDVRCLEEDLGAVFKRLVVPFGTGGQVALDCRVKEGGVGVVETG